MTDLSNFNKRQQQLTRIVEASDLVLIDTNIIGPKGLVEYEWIRKYGSPSDPLAEYLQAPLRRHFLQKFSIEEIERVAKSYGFLNKLIRRMKNIQTVRGVVDELMGFENFYATNIRKLEKGEGRRGFGIKEEENRRKINILRSARSRIRRIVNVLGDRILSIEDPYIEEIRGYIRGIRGKASRVDRDLVAMALYQAILNKRDVSLIENDTDSMRLLVCCFGAILRDRKFNGLIARPHQQRRISLYSCLNDDGVYSLYKYFNFPCFSKEDSQLTSSVTYTPS